MSDDLERRIKRLEEQARSEANGNAGCGCLAILLVLIFLALVQVNDERIRNFLRTLPVDSEWKWETKGEQK